MAITIDDEPSWTSLYGFDFFRWKEVDAERGDTFQRRMGVVGKSPAGRKQNITFPITIGKR